MTHKNTHKAMERRIAKLLKGKRIPLSGSLFFMPGDVVTDEFLVECKLRGSSGKKHISIEKEWLVKIKNEAKSLSKIPLFVFKYKNDKENYLILNLKDFINLTRRSLWNLRSGLTTKASTRSTQKIMKL